MKYKLTIEGTKEEIEKTKQVFHSVGCYDAKSTICQRWDRVPEVEFKIVEPRYRVKTLVELVQEFGEGVEIKSNSVCAFLDIQHCTLSICDLGKDGSCFNNKPDCWKAIFLKEAE